MKGHELLIIVFYLYNIIVKLRTTRLWTFSLPLALKQLGARGIPGYILRILIYWYKNQDMCIRWGDAYSAKLKVTNGVRQGGILSPYLFNVYVDELSEELNKCNVGCNLN